MSEDIICVDSYDFDERINDGIVIVYFYNHMNSQSRAFELIIDEIAEQYYDSLRVLAVDVEQSPDIADRYCVEGLPCVAILNNGEIVEQIEGSNPPYVYTDIIDELL